MPGNQQRDRVRLTQSIRIIAGGDIMLGDHPIMVGRGVASRICRHAGYDPLGGLADIVADGDLAVANLESPLSDPPPLCLPSRRECRAPKIAIEALAASGFHAFTIANNHIQQHGHTAVHETVAALTARGLAAVGLAGDRPGTCRPVDLEVRGISVRLLGYSLRPRQHFSGATLYAEGTTDGILADISAGRDAGRITVVCIHWGDEFVAAPSREQVALGRAMIDAGCSLVLGHHPHVLQGWERYRGGVIAYSLGNLVFDMPWLGEL